LKIRALSKSGDLKKVMQGALAPKEEGKKKIKRRKKTINV